MSRNVPIFIKMKAVLDSYTESNRDICMELKHYYYYTGRLTSRMYDTVIALFVWYRCSYTRNVNYSLVYCNSVATCTWYSLKGCL